MRHGRALNIDFAGPVKATHYLILVDTLSKWSEVIPVNSTTSSGFFAALRRLIFEYGLPD